MMTVRELVFKEISHRKLSFALGIFSMLIAVACVVGSLTLLTAHDLRTEKIVEAKDAAMRGEMTRMEDDYRRIMRELGYNVLILHKDQDIADLYARGYATAYFPEGWVDRLIEGKIQTLNHLLPVLQQKVVWPEQGRGITMIGIRGQTPMPHRPVERSPMMEPVPSGKMDIGDAVARSLNLSVGDKVQLFGKEFVINKRFPRRGNQDDNTIWISLLQAQEILRKPGRINGILALECVCLTESLGKIVEEVTTLLPETQVFEFSSLVVARADARKRAAETHRLAIEQEKSNRAELRKAREGMASVLAPLVMVGSMIWILALTFGNVRERRSEIGILRAIGVRSRQILIAFIGKALVMGAAGAILGFPTGLIIGSLWVDQELVRLNPVQLFDVPLFLTVLLAAPILAGIAAWAPGAIAADQDPAIVLREE
jgi:putative ABC transport system permease protein